MSILPESIFPNNWMKRHVEVQALKTQVTYLEAMVKALQTENYKLRRQHELLVTFNWEPLFPTASKALLVQPVIETLLNYSRKALGQPLYKHCCAGMAIAGKHDHEPHTDEECGGGCPRKAVVARLSGFEQKRNVWPGQPVEPRAGENGCPDKVEPPVGETTLEPEEVSPIEVDTTPQRRTYGVDATPKKEH